MKLKKRQEVSMSVPADEHFLPLTTSFVENAALGLGLGSVETRALILAAEEIFSYFCKKVTPEQGLEIRCQSGGYYVKTDFLFSTQDFNLRLFNLTETVSLDDEDSLEEIGLLIASRFVDRLQVKQEAGQGIQLTLTKEKSYPALDELPALPTNPLTAYSVQIPHPEELKLFALLVNQHYPPQLIPRAFRFPGKLVDMVTGGEFRAALALGPAGQIGGGIVWHWAGAKTVECFGPYLFNQYQHSSIPESLLEACLGAIAKTPAVGLINRFPTEDLPRKHFEHLGSLMLCNQDGAATPLTAYYRQMQEDPGTATWSDPELEEFLRREYVRLVLPREIRLVRNLGETKHPFSVLSAEVDRSQNLVTLRPLRSGVNAEENLNKHVKLFQKESLKNIFFEMDLAYPWQIDFTPALLRSGFKPRLLLPYAGEGDIVIFQEGR